MVQNGSNGIFAKLMMTLFVPKRHETHDLGERLLSPNIGSDVQIITADSVS